MKLNDKIAKANDNFTVYMYDNGFMLEVGGRDANNDWVTAKVLCKNIEELIDLVREATTMERE